MYINCHTYYSLRYGTFSEEDLLNLAVVYGQKTIALTDINNTSACLNFVRLAQNKGIKPVIGVDFRHRAQPLYVALAANNAGFQEINAWLSAHSHAQKDIPEHAPHFENVKVIYPYKQVQKLNKKHFEEYEYIGLNLGDLPYFHNSPWRKFTQKLVFLHPITFRNKTDFNIHRLLRAIDNNTLLSKLSPEQQADVSESFVENLTSALSDTGGDNYIFLLKNTHTLLETCNVSFDFSAQRPHQNLLSYSGSEEQDMALLKLKVYEGLNLRYPTVTEQISSRIEKELDTIKQMNFVAFFLVNWDIIQYCKRMNYFHVGRGSGANSIVAYLLYITDVDPIELDLYFERFMNLFRTSPPDFDIDFSWRDREDVTRYIFERFGKNGQVALLATYNTFQHSGAIRELGKVFGLPKHEIDMLSEGNYSYEKLDAIPQLIVRYAKRIHGMPNHLSVHSSGILISEKPMHYFSATDLPPKGFPTVQFDMIIAETVGLYKYDILAQRGLSKIKDSLEIIKKNQPEAPEIDIHNVKPFLVDPLINAKISQAQCIGCFYVESPAMRMLLRKLEVDNYLTLVAASSIIRPGVSQSGMMREYILRHRDPERRKQAHPIMWELMEDTYGVMVYQEDVIKVAHKFAGLGLAEADVLRRGMSGKFRSSEEFRKVNIQFVENCREKGYPEKIIHEVWTQIESFAGYAFAKGHSASYAIESYQCLYLKTYYPLEFMVAVLNNGGGFYRVETYIHEARLHGAEIIPPQINLSTAQTHINGKKICLGFEFLSGIEANMVDAIVTERQTNGPFTSLQDFLDRIHIGIEQMDILLRIGAFDFTGINKRTLLWEAHFRLNKTPPKTLQQELFRTPPKKFSLPKLSSSQLEDVFDQIELLGYPLCDPFDLLLESPLQTHFVEDMPKHINQTITMYGYWVNHKKVKTSRGERMFFGTFLDQRGQWIDTVHFPPVAAQYPFRGRGIYQLIGKVVDEFGFLSLEIIEMKHLAYITDPRFSEEKSEHVARNLTSPEIETLVDA
ncbi:MAG TPA: DNA polymerase III subunit alpha [Leadbetterella sp.]|nr:DNA polymerase III subunit alpha [Leadbetterella sp.]